MATPDHESAQTSEKGSRAQVRPAGGGGEAGEPMDFALLEDSLAKTPWERMQANDDALRFAEALRVAMEQRNAES